MDDKQNLIDTVKDAALPQEVKDDLISRIVSQGPTKELAKEVADVLDLQADVLDLSADVAEQKGKAYEELAKELAAADKEEEDETSKVLDEANKQLDELEKQGSQAEPEEQAQAGPTQDISTPPSNPSQTQ